MVLAERAQTPPVIAPGGAVALGLAALYVLWGGTYLGNKVALESISPLLLTSSRFAVAGLILLAAARVLGRPLWPGRAQWRGAAVTGIFLVGAGSSLLAIGQRSVDSGLASLIIASMPLWALAIAWGSGQRPRLLAACGIFVGFVGLVLLLSASVVGGGSVAGIVTLLCSTLTWAIGSTLAQRLTMPADPFTSSGWQMLVGSAAVVVLAALSGEVTDMGTLNVTGRSAFAWLALTLLCTAVGFSAYGWLLRTTSLRLATTYAYVNPVVAVVLGGLVLDERLTLDQLPGAALVLAAVAVVVAAERRVSGTRAGVEPGVALGEEEGRR